MSQAANGGRSGKGKMPRSAERHQTNLITCELGQIVDLSRTGMRVTSDKKPKCKVGQLVQLTLRSPGDSLPLVGRIMWTKRKGFRGTHQIGVMFVNVRPRAAADIQSLAEFGFIHRNKEGATSSEPQIRIGVDTPEHYQLLGLAPGATDDEIQSAFRSLARKYHPDVNPDGQEHFIKIKQAFEILRDPRNRSMRREAG